jgi:putative CocE/NonD family hydrolase
MKTTRSTRRQTPPFFHRAPAPALLAALALLAATGGACSKDDNPGGEPPPDVEKPAVNTAFYLTMRDGVRIAVDLWLPGNASATSKVPTVIRATRYSRDHEVLNRSAVAETDTEAEARAFVREGFAQVIVDARGSAASFGVRRQPWSADEGADYAEIVDWIVAQPWSNGRLASFGESYDGNTAEMIGTLGKSAVKAVVPRFGYPNIYTDIVFPGGVFNEGFVKAWLTRNLSIDRNDLCGFAGVSGEECAGYNAAMSLAKQVDADTDHALRSAAIAQHAGSPDQIGSVSAATYADDRWNGADFASLSPGSRWAKAQSTETPFMAWASWMDLGTAGAALNRWRALDVPMTLYLGPWNHGASLDADVYSPPEAQPGISKEEQHALTVSFLEQHLVPSSTPASARKIVYFTMGESVRKETAVWPPAGTVMTPFYLREQQALSSTSPATVEAPDRYTVDFTASTGASNGWWTKFSAADVVYDDRRSEDAKLLVYTTPPLAVDTEITGHPTVTLYLSSTGTDGALFVYLEDVAPDGRSTYITEGQLRLLHRKLCTAGPRDAFGPCHTYLAKDAAPMPPGVVQEVTLGLSPTSALLRAGHSIRIAVAGADASTFARIPASGTPALTVAHGPAHPSRIELPIARR